MKTEAAHSSTTKVNFNHTTRHHITKHSNPQGYGHKTRRNWLNAKAEKTFQSTLSGQLLVTYITSTKHLTQNKL